MEKMTITEALAEVKLIEKKVEKKVAHVQANLVRYEHITDPYQKEGGSQEVMRRELQAIADLDKRLVGIRGAIANANISNTLTIGEHARSIYDWITWKREIAEKRNKMYGDLSTTLKRFLDKEAAQPTVYKTDDAKVHLAKIILNVDYAATQEKYEKDGSLLETLDGKLSLKNATTLVEF
jgi:hypothetical protein